jgi:hypothetical protein
VFEFFRLSTLDMWVLLMNGTNIYVYGYVENAARRRVLVLFVIMFQ